MGTPKLAFSSNRGPTRRGGKILDHTETTYDMTPSKDRLGLSFTR
jgi:hypothetical protein